MPANEAEVRIRDLRVTLKRRGGFSWGPDPAALVDAATRALLAALARELAALGHGAGVAIDELALRVRLSLPELLALASGRAPPLPRGAAVGPVRFEVADDQVPETLRARLRDALRQATARATAAPLPEPQAQSAAEAVLGREPLAGELDPELAAEEYAGVVRLNLFSLARGSVLRAALASAPPEPLRRWDALFDAAGGEAAAEPDPVLVASVEEHAAAALGQRDELARLRARIEAQISLEQRGLAPAAALRKAIDHVLPRIAAVPAIEPPRSSPGSAVAPHSMGSRPPQQAARLELDVPSVLPFLVLGSLSRAGFVAVASAWVTELCGPAALPAFAAALAYKVLSPPSRGWLRAEPDLRSAAAFALCAEPPGEPELGRLAAALAPHTEPLELAIVQALARGRAARDPVLCVPCEHRAVQGTLVAERLGLFPVAFCADDAARDRVLHALGDPVQVADAAAQERLLAVWQAIAHDRPSAIHAAQPALDRSLSLAAALGLSDLAYTLFRAREPTDALLALERFADLSGVLHTGAETLRLRLPLGARYLDLRARGLLADITSVPWFGGRALSFAGG